MSEYKVGDKVRVISSFSQSTLDVGDVATILSIDKSSESNMYFVGTRNPLGYFTLHESEFVMYSEELEEDNVDHPPHYGNGEIECIDYLEDFMTTEEFIGYLRGNIGKYMHRWRYKNGLEDLLKAEWYLKKLITVMKG